MSLHPAVALAAWGAFSIALQQLDLSWLAVLAAPSLGLATTLAGRQAWRLVRRARWLLMTLVLLFVLATPGERLPGLGGSLGLTYDGFWQAGEHGLRLLVLLVTLGGTLHVLGRSGLLAALYSLLPFLGSYRERLLV